MIQIFTRLKRGASSCIRRAVGECAHWGICQCSPARPMTHQYRGRSFSKLGPNLSMKQALSVRCRICHPLARQGPLNSSYRKAWLTGKTPPDEVVSESKRPSCVMNLAALIRTLDARMWPHTRETTHHQHQTVVCATSHIAYS